MHSHRNHFEIVSTQEDVFRIKHEFYRFSLIFYVDVWKRHTKYSKCPGRLKETKDSIRQFVTQTIMSRPNHQHVRSCIKCSIAKS